MLKAVQLEKRFFRKTGDANFFCAVDQASLTLNKGTLTMLTGRSGSGKTTLLQMLAGLLQPSGGQVTLDETDLYALDDNRLSALRATHIAVIPQVNAAVNALTVWENILLPTMLAGRDVEEAAANAAAMLERLGIAHLKEACPSELSGGEKRRMSIIRALVSGAEVILADEPTGDLDDENTEIVLSLLREAADRGAAVLLVTHEKSAKKWADSVLTMHSGRIETAEGREEA